MFYSVLNFGGNLTVKWAEEEVWGDSGAADCLRACPVGVLLASAGSAWWEATTGGPGKERTAHFTNFKAFIITLTFGGQFCGVVVLWSVCGVSYRLPSPHVSCRGNYASFSSWLRMVGDD